MYDNYQVVQLLNTISGKLDTIIDEECAHAGS